MLTTKAILEAAWPMIEKAIKSLSVTRSMGTKPVGASV